VNRHAYFDRMPDDKMRQYSASWSDEQVTEWDGNFRDDAALFLICSERDVEIGPYRFSWRWRRREVALHIPFRR
jgi:hypothetical protein